MRVQIDNGRKEVDINVSDAYGTRLLDIVMQALAALDYTKEDVKEYLEEQE